MKRDIFLNLVVTLSLAGFTFGQGGGGGGGGAGAGGSGASAGGSATGSGGGVNNAGAGPDVGGASAAANGGGAGSGGAGVNTGAPGTVTGGSNLTGALVLQPELVSRARASIKVLLPVVPLLSRQCQHGNAAWQQSQFQQFEYWREWSRCRTIRQS